MFGILVFGDSIGHGRGENPSHGWVGRLKEYFEAKDFFYGIYNLSIPGETSFSLLKRLEQEAKPRMWTRKADDKYVIIIAVGGNDCAGVLNADNPQIKPDDFKKNMQLLIQQAKKLTEFVVCVGIGPVDEKKSMPRMNHYFANKTIIKYNEILKSVCAQSAENGGTVFVDIDDRVREQNYIDTIVDGVHPNSKGYDILYDVIKKELVEKKIIP